jgi:hypothetical protein
MSEFLVESFHSGDEEDETATSRSRLDRGSDGDQTRRRGLNKFLRPHIRTSPKANDR